MLKGMGTIFEQLGTVVLFFPHLIQFEAFLVLRQPLSSSKSLVLLPKQRGYLALTRFNKVKDLFFRKMEFAVSRGVQPKYDCQTVGGLSHNPIFTCACTYKDFKEQAEGGNKKIAKHLAAKKIYYRVISYSVDLLLSASSIKSKYAEIEKESKK